MLTWSGLPGPCLATPILQVLLGLGLPWQVWGAVHRVPLCGFLNCVEEPCSASLGMHLIPVGCRHLLQPLSLVHFLMVDLGHVVSGQECGLLLPCPPPGPHLLLCLPDSRRGAPHCIGRVPEASTSSFTVYSYFQPLLAFFWSSDFCIYF